MSVRKRILCVLCAIVMLVSTACLFVGCEKKTTGKITSFEDLKAPGTRIGVAYDLPEYDMLVNDYPEAEIIAYNSDELGYGDVASGRLDAYIYIRLEMEFAIDNGRTGVRLLDEDYSERTVAVGISPVSKIPDLEKKINTFIKMLRIDGTLEDMYDRWALKGEDTMPDIPKAENPQYHLCVGTTGTVMPFSYFVGTELRGYDIELAYRFAAWLGADIEFKIYDFAGVVAAAATGDVDCVMSNLFKTSERGESIPFSDELFDMNLTAMVRDGGSSGAGLTLSDLEHATVAVITGSNFPEHVLSSLPEANIMYFNTTADCMNALKTGKVDAVAEDEPVARNILAQDNSFAVLPEMLESVNYGFVFQKSAAGAAIRDKLNVVINRIKSDGTMTSMWKKWFDSGDLSDMELPDYQSLPATNGTLKLATIQSPPFSYTVEGRAGGYEIELFYMFCKEYGYALEVTDVNMDGLLSAVQSGKYDSACCGISITEERKESMYFSDPDYSGGTVLIVRNTGGEKTDKNFFETIADSFNKTFVRENRWKLFLQGIGTTMLITALSIIFGTALGFIVFMLCRKGNRVATAITKFCIWLIHGMPVVVLLMILYYIIFSEVAISGTVVSIVGFTLIFASAVFSMMKQGVGAIDVGQTEAAYALGYTDRRAFFRVVLPQALPHFMPTYKSEITSLIKATAVVGYVAVQDLTKMGDIVRSRTYEAFFPLIAVAVIYFVMAAILTFIVNKIEIRIDPRRRSRKDILKGVNGK
ncbi:MAG: transporter substrate-binding domain-containing protein [Clostridia bacterium]|nr:transporter substrate-binding domain-containing protein [Clostridia bacterium]